MKTALFLVAFCGAQARAAPYVLQPSGEKVSLIQTRTRRVVWTQKATDSAAIWSADHRAVALQSSDGFLLWREGGKRVLIPNPTIPGSSGKDRYDYAMGGVWSPDKRSFLARYGVSGMADIGWGRVFCFKLNRDGSYSSRALPGPYATKVAWRGNKTALYWILKEQTFQPIAKPRRWRVP